MKTSTFSTMHYEAPCLLTEEVLIEVGYGVSGGHVGGDSSFEEED